MIKNMIGLEAEAFLRKEGSDELVVASEVTNRHDDFPLLAEIRGEPGIEVSSAVANFMSELYHLRKLLPSGYYLDMSSSFYSIPASLYSKCMHIMGTKELSKAKNIYGTDMTELNDMQIVDGKIQSTLISAGLHVHFSSTVEDTISVPVVDQYTSVSIPLKFGDADISFSNLYKRIEAKGEPRKVTAKVNQITRPVLEYIVKKMDEELLPKYAPEEKMKYRMPGWYEIKPYGFEYRSLPMDNLVLNTLYQIAEYSFSLLDDLALVAD